MIAMDVKGINWVGCVYEKFESMCLEVEENMYQVGPFWVINLHNRMVAIDCWHSSVYRISATFICLPSSYLQCLVTGFSCWSCY